MLFLSSRVVSDLQGDNKNLAAVVQAEEGMISFLASVALYLVMLIFVD